MYKYRLIILVTIFTSFLYACSFYKTDTHQRLVIEGLKISRTKNIDNSTQTQLKSQALINKRKEENSKDSIDQPEPLEKEVTISPNEIEKLEESHKNSSRVSSNQKQKIVTPINTTETDFNFVLKIKDTKYTERYFNYYSKIQRKTFQRWLKRAEPYLPYILSVFRRYNIPDDLIFLPFAESGFNPRAYSRAGAAGIWQFMPATARKYGLTVNWWIDERLDPFRSTIAAAKYLSDLYKMFGDWYLALAAYNAGEGKISKALRKSKMNNFFHIAKPRYLRRETRMYVPKFMAILKIIRNLKKLGFEPIYVDNKKLPARVFVREGTDLYTLAKNLKIPWKEFKKWNSHFKRYVTPPNIVSLIYVPKALKARAINLIKTKTIRPYGGLYRYRIKNGDSWWRISRRFGVPINILKRINRTNSNMLRPGRSILIPKSKAFFLARKGSNNKFLRTYGSSKWKNSRGNYIVKTGDTLWGIAKKFNIPLTTLLVANRLSKRSVLTPGMKLYVPITDYKSLKNAQKALKQILYRVKKGDNLWGIAKKFGVTTNQLVTWNNLNRDARIYPGDKLKIFIESAEN
ncbi:LysM peptidoglycan-binding domain-containing protein [Desulfothermus okinawensis JCM 13304]